MRFELPYVPGIGKFIDGLPSDLRSQISDMYFSDSRMSTSARHIWYDQSPGEDRNWLELQSLKTRYNIEMHYVMNPSVWKNNSYLKTGIKDIKVILDKVWQQGCTWLTINNPLLLRMKDFRDDIPPFKIKLSINNHIATLEEVQFAYEHSRLRHFVIDRRSNRDLDELKRIYNWTKDRECTLTLLAQESCIPDCQWKGVCDNMISTYNDNQRHEVNDLQNIHSANLCHDHYEHGSPADIFKSPTILPSMIDEYGGMIDYIKFAGRERDINEFQHTILSYLERSDDISIHSILPKATTKLMNVRV